MPRKKLDRTDLEEFNRRLEACNEYKRMELDQRESKLAQVEKILSHYEQTLDELESRTRLEKNASPSQIALRKRVKELARKTNEMATLL